MEGRLRSLSICRLVIGGTDIVSGAFAPCRGRNPARDGIPNQRTKLAIQNKERTCVRAFFIIRRSRDVETSRCRGINLRSSDAALPSAIPPKFDPLTFAHEAIVAYTNHRTVSIQQTLGLSMCKHLINRALSYKGLGPFCVKLHEPHASLSSEVVEADVCIIDSKRME